MKSLNIIWISRIALIIYSLMLSLFAFDVFDPNDPILYRLGGFLIHLLPSLLLVLVLILTWKKPLPAGILFFIAGIGFTFLFRTYKEFLTFLIISLPLILIGVLYILSHFVMKSSEKLNKQGDGRFEQH